MLKSRSWLIQGALWLGPYLLLVLAPTGLVLLSTPYPGRGFWIEFSVGLGFAGSIMLCLQFMLTARFAHVATVYGQDAMLQFHRQMGMVAAVFILTHHTLLLVVEPAYVEYLDPRANLLRALALAFALIALGLLIIPSLWRKSLGIPYEWWRLTHGILSFLLVGIGLVHTLQVGHYVSDWWKQAFWVGLIGIALLLLLQVRVIRPLIMRRHPYRVVEVRREGGKSWTLALEPEGHSGMNFRAGQYAWLTLGDSPFSLHQHPFSFSSSALSPRRLEFTIKELGDFTRTIGQVPPGSRAYLEGPFGAFNIDINTSDEIVFIAGGIGVTPIMSMLRTLQDRGDRRPLMLIYAANCQEEILFREELDELRRHLNLGITYVLANPEDGWEGERLYHRRDARAPSTSARKPDNRIFHLRSGTDDEYRRMCAVEPSNPASIYSHGALRHQRGSRDRPTPETNSGAGNRLRDCHDRRCRSFRSAQTSLSGANAYDMRSDTI